MNDYVNQEQFPTFAAQTQALATTQETKWDCWSVLALASPLGRLSVLIRVHNEHAHL